MGKRSVLTSNMKKERRMKRKKLEQRKKLEKNKKHDNAEPASGKTNLPYDYNRPIYKFFEKEEYADDLLCGNVHLGTLNTYRAYEDAEQGDKEEAHQTYLSGNLVGSSNDSQFVEKARRSGINIANANCDNIKITGGTNITLIQDAYVFCTSTEYLPKNMSEKIGTKHCVKIKDPERFFNIVSRKINSISAIRQAAMGKVIYKDRHYTGLEQPPGPIGFVKPAFPYEKQKEFRFLWLMQSPDKLKPFQINCPEIRELCERV